jgi:conjugal transfer pilus assembly protein TraL
MNKRSLYLVCKTLDQPVRLIGLPLDEFIPTVILGGLFFSLGKVITALVLMVLVVIAMRVMKKGQGSGWLLNLSYWYLPTWITQSFLRFVPASKHREWIS